MPDAFLHSHHEIDQDKVKQTLFSFQVEDSSCKYRPVCSSFTKFPLIDLSNIKPATKKTKELPVPKLDFDKENQETNHTQSIYNAVSTENKTRQSNKRKDDSKSKTARQAKPVKPKNGYCEICDAFYTDLNLHTKSESHEQIVCKKEYWSTLDEVVNSLPNLDYLIENICRKVQNVPKFKLSSPFQKKHSSCLKSTHSVSDVQSNVSRDHVNTSSIQEEIRESKVQNEDRDITSGEQNAKHMHYTGLESETKSDQKSDNVTVINNCEQNSGQDCVKGYVKRPASSTKKESRVEIEEINNNGKY